MRAIRFDKRPGCFDELRNASVCTTVNQCLANAHSLADFFDQIIDLRGRGATFLHTRTVQVEMTDIASSAIFVRLFAQHDLVNESRGSRVRPRTPWDFDASLGPLQRFQKRHEVPHRKDMVFHEDTEVGQRIDHPVERMSKKFHTKGLDIPCESLKGAHRLLSFRSADSYKPKSLFRSQETDTSFYTRLACLQYGNAHVEAQLNASSELKLLRCGHGPRTSIWQNVTMYRRNPVVTDAAAVLAELSIQALRETPEYREPAASGNPNWEPLASFPSACRSVLEDCLTPPTLSERRCYDKHDQTPEQLSCVH